MNRSTSQASPAGHDCPRSAWCWTDRPTLSWRSGGRRCMVSVLIFHKTALRLLYKGACKTEDEEVGKVDHETKSNQVLCCACSPARLCLFYTSTWPYTHPDPAVETGGRMLCRTNSQPCSLVNIDGRPYAGHGHGNGSMSANEIQMTTWVCMMQTIYEFVKQHTAVSFSLPDYLR
jgi:hypothetical protein